MLVILMALFPILFCLVLDWIFAGTSKDMHTLEMLRTVASDPEKLGTVLLVVVFVLAVTIFILAPLGSYLMRGGGKRTEK